MAASRKGKSVGQAIAITTLTPIRDLPKLRRRLRIVRYGPAFGRPLERLTFIYFARWTIIDRLPPGQSLHTPYLLFESNFDGGLVEYLDAFADRLPTRIAALWQTCFGFAEDVMRRARGKRFPPGDFKRFVAKNELRVLHFYVAYPDATTRTVRQAIALADRLRRKRGRVDATAAALALGPAPEERTWPVRLGRTLAAWWRNVTGRYGVSPLTLALPLEPVNANEVIARLDQLDQHDSPLADVPGTHFARFVLIEPKLIELGQPQPDVLERPYLLFTSNHDGSREDYLRALAPAADWVWRACAEHPDGDAAGWLAAHAIETRYFVTGFPARTVDAVRDALGRRGGVRREIAR